jgi:hypothetical protein
MKAIWTGVAARARKASVMGGEEEIKLFTESFPVEIKVLNVRSVRADALVSVGDPKAESVAYLVYTGTGRTDSGHYNLIQSSNADGSVFHVFNREADKKKWVEIEEYLKQVRLKWGNSGIAKAARTEDEASKARVAAQLVESKRRKDLVNVFLNDDVGADAPIITRIKLADHTQRRYLAGVRGTPDVVKARLKAMGITLVGLAGVGQAPDSDDKGPRLLRFVSAKAAEDFAEMMQSVTEFNSLITVTRVPPEQSQPLGHAHSAHASSQVKLVLSGVDGSPPVARKKLLACGINLSGLVGQIGKAGADSCGENQRSMLFSSQEAADEFSEAMKTFTSLNDLICVSKPSVLKDQSTKSHPPQAVLLYVAGIPGRAIKVMAKLEAAQIPLDGIVGTFGDAPAGSAGMGKRKVLCFLPTR